MKKILSVFLLISMVCTFTFAVSAADPIFLLDFKKANYDSILELSGSDMGGDAEWEFMDDSVKVTVVNGPDEGSLGDPNIAFSADYINSDEYQWVKVRLKNESDAGMFEMHFASDGTGGGITGESCTQMPISQKDTEYKEYIFNIRDLNLKSPNPKNTGTTITESMWTGEVTSIRLDFMWKSESGGQMSAGSTMYVDYFGLFKTEDDAKAFRATAAPVETTVAPAETVATPADTVASDAVAAVTPAPVAQDAVPAPVAPQTSDAAVIIGIAMLLASIAATVILKKRVSK